MLGKFSKTLISKTKLLKSTGGVAQAVEHLPSMYEAPVLCPQYCKKQKIKTKPTGRWILNN
jgi:hypothetical protein